MHKKIYIALLILLSSVSCTDFLEVDPANEIVIKDVADVKGTMALYLSGAVDPFTSTDVRQTKVNFLPSWITTQQLGLFQSDELDSELFPSMGYALYTQMQAQYVQGVRWQQIDRHTTLWNEGYAAIGFCNQILKELGNASGKEADKQIIEGEARTIRVWNAFKLLQFFCVYDNNDYGIPLNLDADNVTGYKGLRWTQSDLYDFFIEELNEVLQFDVKPEEDYNIFFNKYVIHSLLANIYQFKALSAAQESSDWENARLNAVEVLEKISIVSEQDDYLNLFKQDNTASVLHKNNPHALLVFYWGRKSNISHSNIWGKPLAGRLDNAMPATEELVSLFEEGDIRYWKDSPPSRDYNYNGAFIFHNIENERKFICKYPYDRYRVNNETYAMFRAEEMHLIIAEAYARTNQTTEATQWLDEFKQAKNTDAYSSTDVLEEIMNERRKEFLAEHEMRWLDMKRTNHTVTRKFNDSELGEVSLTLEPDDYRYAFMIPNRELTYNLDLKQNPNW